MKYLCFFALLLVSLLLVDAGISVAKRRIKRQDDIDPDRAVTEAYDYGEEGDYDYQATTSSAPEQEEQESKEKPEIEEEYPTTTDSPDPVTTEDPEEVTTSLESEEDIFISHRKLEEKTMETEEPIASGGMRMVTTGPGNSGSNFPPVSLGHPSSGTMTLGQVKGVEVAGSSGLVLTGQSQVSPSGGGLWTGMSIDSDTKHAGGQQMIYTGSSFTGSGFGSGFSSGSGSWTGANGAGSGWPQTGSSLTSGSSSDSGYWLAGTSSWPQTGAYQNWNTNNARAVQTGTSQSQLQQILRNIQRPQNNQQYTWTFS